MTKFCTNCGAKLSDNVRFCTNCGAPTRTGSASAGWSANERAADAARRLQSGEESAFSDLFDSTKAYVATCIRAQNVPDAYIDDVMQEVYLKAYRSIGGLAGPEKVVGWLKSIAFNASFDFLRSHLGRRSEVAAETVTDGEMDAAMMNDAALDADMRLPEDIAESTEIQRILLGFVDELPEDYRSLFYARYLNELSAADIARTCGINENTVRSRLMRCRRQLQQRVDAYAEQTGTKMRYSAIAPVLWLLLRDRTVEAATSSTLGADQVLARVHEAAASQSATASSSSPAAVASSSARKVGWFASHRFLVIVVAVVVAIVAAGGVVLASTSPSSSSDQGSAASDAAQPEQTDASATDDTSAMMAAYAKVLDDAAAGKYDFTNDGAPSLVPTNRASDYALQDIDGDGSPELLVRCPGTDSSFSTSTDQKNMLVFTYKGGDAATKYDGAVTFWYQSSDRHAQTDLYTKSGNSGVYKRVYDRNGYVANSTSMVSDPTDPTVANTYTYSAVSVSGNALVETDLGSSIPGDVGGMVTFVDIADRSLLGQAAGSAATGGDGSGGDTTSDAGDGYAGKVAAARAAGRTVYEGTLREMSGLELLQYQDEVGDASGISGDVSYIPASETGATVLVLVFDQATTTTAQSGGGFGEMRSVSQHGLAIDGSVSEWEPYLGSRIAVAAEPSRGWFSSEADRYGYYARFELSVASDLVATS